MPDIVKINLNKLQKMSENFNLGNSPLQPLYQEYLTTIFKKPSLVGTSSLIIIGSVEGLSAELTLQLLIDDIWG